MTPPLTPLPAPVDIWLLVYPGFVLLDAAGPLQVFASANDEARDAGRAPPYRLHVVADGAGAVMSAAGIALLASALPRRLANDCTLMVAGGADAALPAGATPSGRRLLRWVARASGAAACCCAVCTGAFVLARAGLLDGRRAVTHWQDVPALRAQHPAVLVQDDALHVRDGKFHTSAGISAGMDLALSLVEQDLGRAAALAVARRMVLFLKRPGGQRQFSTALLAQAQDEGVGGRLAAWLRPRLARRIDVAHMAHACSLSMRTLHRRLRQEMDTTPAQLLANLRMELACELLGRTGASVKEVARRSGHGSEYNLRRAFVTRLGVLPSEYRERFA